MSHPCVIPVNQLPFDRLGDLGWDVHLVVPDRWKDEYRPGGFAPEIVAGLSRNARRLPVLFSGRPQRHFHVASPSRIVEAVDPDVAFFEQEPFAVVAGQWLRAVRRRGVPFGVQHAENLDRSLPPIAVVIRSLVLARAAFVAARSPQAAALLQPLRPGLRTEVVPHAVPDWSVGPRASRADAADFTVGYAGRLTEAKGIRDLLAATATMAPGVRLLVVGNGELRAEVLAASTTERPIELRTDVGHADMPASYQEMDVLVLPSRSTPTWTEQFGRVLVEAMACGVPAVASDSGEMPWVMETTGGGVLFPEGDVSALARTLSQLRTDPARRRALAERGQAEVALTFSEGAVVRQLDELLSDVVLRKGLRRRGAT